LNSPDQQNRYVLVVDAGKDDLFYTCTLLHRLGYRVFTAYTAEKAIEFMTAVPPAAVIVDAAPSGAPLIPNLTQDPRFFDIPLILLSWWPHSELDARTRQAKFFAYLRKPPDVIQLFRTVQMAMEKSPRRNIRIASYLPVRLEDGLDGAEGYATALSEYGMFFRTFEPRRPHSLIPVTIEISGRLIRAEAEVLYTVAFEEGPFREPGLGMKFTTISRKDRETIAAFILDQIEKGTARPSPQT